MVLTDYADAALMNKNMVTDLGYQMLNGCDKM
ncbi:hypothetical protein QO005_001446 [Rhizobium paknamense]|uniref:Uncharacterized protein n=1 Tax=Rhizobium paknamense TaxID=1206817 RepID=A0ABU0IA61_9HYPH|nr:hypothetical protein [Rhizobium paknamense]